LRSACQGWDLRVPTAQYRPAGNDDTRCLRQAPLRGSAW